MHEWRGTRFFYKDDPSQIESLHELAEHLFYLFNSSTYVAEIEKFEHPILLEAKALVDRLDGLKIVIYPKEHPPPHFHVVGGDTDASFRLDTGELIGGIINTRNKKKVQYWFSQQQARKALLHVWNSTRPDDCAVGYFTPEQNKQTKMP